jgi:proline iminopeptidase
MLAFLAPVVATGQDLYMKTFGSNTDRPVIFLHGGPGYNAASFEATTAARLADSGFFVIVYDRRGEGRSPANASYTFAQTFEDINAIYAAHGLKKATLIGHSFGGVVATLFARTFPDKTAAVVLAGAPVSLQETFRTIIHKAKGIYTAGNDTAKLKFIDQLEKMDTASIIYSSYNFMVAMQNGFYSPKVPSQEAARIYVAFRKDTLARYAGKMTTQAPQGFWKNEQYTTLDLTADLKALVARGVRIYGLYGKEDGLYAPAQVAKLAELIGTTHVQYFDSCSHSVFIDQQTAFIDALKSWTKPSSR